ncbi:MAG: hypothetical protein EX266_00705 [Rhodobacteraceae bacterium]|nr:MAG: hypothetical protein EX266_00705 [Paracoccaceae bacterium]
MEINALPHYDDSVNETGCCPRFNPVGWDGQELHFKDKRFLRAVTLSAMHIPLNMGKTFARVDTHVEDSGGWDDEDMIVLSRDLSAFKAEHFFAVPRSIPDEEMVTLSGDFVTKVFEGPYRDASEWLDDMREVVRENGGLPGKVYFFYTTCPKCAKHYGKNYVVGVAEI